MPIIFVCVLQLVCVLVPTARSSVGHADGFPLRVGSCFFFTSKYYQCGTTHQHPASQKHHTKNLGLEAVFSSTPLFVAAQKHGYRVTPLVFTFTISTCCGRRSGSQHRGGTRAGARLRRRSRLTPTHGRWPVQSDPGEQKTQRRADCAAPQRTTQRAAHDLLRHGESGQWLGQAHGG